ncbi:MAG: hypothetical protein ACJAYU_004826 [Bradymonadia bacterium]
MAAIAFALTLLGTLVTHQAPAAAQSRLETTTTGGGVTALPPTCVRLTQDGEWVSEPILAHPLLPFLSSKAAAWGAFAGAALLLYLLSFALFQNKLRAGGSPLNAFGKALTFWILAVGVAGYFATGHLSYAENWCVDSSQGEIVGAAPARSDVDVIARYGVGINEVVDRRAIPLKAHIRLTPWYFWLGGVFVLGLFFHFGFRTGGASPPAGGASTPTTSGRAKVEKW